jgi:hypothetical protein
MVGRPFTGWRFHRKALSQEDWAMRSPRTAARQALDPARRTAADRHLQGEIDKAIAGLVDGAPAEAACRLARVLAAVLEPSWAEHTSFQNEALFPIVAREERLTPDIPALLERLGREHGEIGAYHREVTTILTRIVARQRAATAAECTCLSEALELRRRHHAAEAVLEDLIPVPLDAADRATLADWTASREAPPFPVNLIYQFWE